MEAERTIPQVEKEPTKIELINRELSSLDVEITTTFSVVHDLFTEFDMDKDVLSSDVSPGEPKKLDKLEEILYSVRAKKESIITLMALINQFKSRV